ncbi:MAG: phosphoribosylglycinamide formyltransferase [Planctomycetota bacterium]|nr:phosphoribosylglycinamide formyltransferase [Planctomycetota bacterium]
MNPPRLGILLSGSGRTLQNLIDRIAHGRLTAQIAVVISDKELAFGLQRASEAGIPHVHLRDATAIWQALREYQVDLVCLCGYLRLLPIERDFAQRVLNIHPSLLPKYGGKGMYGSHVHEAVLNSGDRESGCTVHICTNEYDRGEMIKQQRVPVLPGDSPDSLAARVFAAECESYPVAIEQQWQLLQRHTSR